MARAYIDQLVRSNVIDAGQVDALSAALDQADAALARGARDAQVASQLAGMVAGLNSQAESRSGATQVRYQGLASTVAEIADRLR